MAFAEIKSDLSYWQKQVKPLFPDLAWNIPEQKTGRLSIVGGNSQNFSTVIRISEFISQTFPLKSVATILPDTLRGKLPPLPNLDFMPATASGSFAKSAQLRIACETSDATLLIGDLSKNSETAVALGSAVLSPTDNTHNLLVITRDAVDLLSGDAERLLERPQTFLVASMLQLQKLFRAVYYPRMIMLSQPLLPIIETLHKFTLTYPVTLLTFHENNIIVAHDGEITTTPIANTSYTPIALWSGQLAAKVAAFNLYNPDQPLAATTASILFN